MEESRCESCGEVEDRMYCGPCADEHLENALSRSRGKMDFKATGKLDHNVDLRMPRRFGVVAVEMIILSGIWIVNSSLATLIMLKILDMLP